MSESLIQEKPVVLLRANICLPHSLLTFSQHAKSSPSSPFKVFNLLLLAFQYGYTPKGIYTRVKMYCKFKMFSIPTKKLQWKIDAQVFKTKFFLKECDLFLIIFWILIGNFKAAKENKFSKLSDFKWLLLRTQTIWKKE